MKPGLEVLESSDEGDWAAAEAKWIAYYAERSPLLTNVRKAVPYRSMELQSTGKKHVKFLLSREARSILELYQSKKYPGMQFKYLLEIILREEAQRQRFSAKDISRRAELIDLPPDETLVRNEAKRERVQIEKEKSQ